MKEKVKTKKKDIRFSDKEDNKKETEKVQNTPSLCLKRKDVKYALLL